MRTSPTFKVEAKVKAEEDEVEVKVKAELEEEDRERMMPFSEVPLPFHSNSTPAWLNAGG
jgi:hypothetical protein